MTTKTRTTATNMWLLRLVVGFLICILIAPTHAFTISTRYHNKNHDVYSSKIATKTKTTRSRTWIYHSSRSIDHHYHHHHSRSLLLLRHSQTVNPNEEDHGTSGTTDYDKNYSSVLKRRHVQLPLLDMSSIIISDQSSSLPQDDVYKKNQENDHVDDVEEEMQMVPIIPLPASHLPDELATLQLYGIQLKTGMHKLMMKDITTLSSTSSSISSSSFGSNAVVSLGGVGMGLGLGGDLLGEDGGELFPVFGYVVEKKSDDWVGAIGCAADVVFVMDEKTTPQIEEGYEDEYGDGDGDGDSGVENDNDSLIVLCKGSFRFVVKEMLQTFPYPIAIVDELLDEEQPPLVVGSLDGDGSENDGVTTVVEEYNDFQSVFEDIDIEKQEDDDLDNDDDDDEEEEEDALMTVDASELIPRTMAAMKTLVDQKLNVNRPNMTPLEVAILKESGRDPTFNTGYLEKNRAEEMAAILDIFSNSLLDIAPSKMERLYVVAIMAAEIAGLDNDIRKKILTMVDGVARLRLVLAEAQKKISLVQAKKITEEIMQKSDEGSKELKVGVPSLPPWAKNIKKGMKIEYFWNEIEGWCKGEVIETPVMVLDELIVTVRFEDGDVEKLPFRADEKARWRPGGMGR